MEINILVTSLAIVVGAIIGYIARSVEVRDECKIWEETKDDKKESI